MKPAIEISHVSRRFSVAGGEFWALKDVTVTIPEGILAILKGRSGSGKTTLLNIIGALDAPSKGTVRIDGREIGGLTERQRDDLHRRQMGFVFQAVSLIPSLNAYQNVEFSLRMAGIREGRKRRAEECLKLVGLGNRMTHMPAQMSGGEQQRVAIAIALANAPKLLLADEPTGSVDSKTAEAIFHIFAELNREGQTILIVTHDVALSKKVRRVVAIRDGKISSERILREKYADRLRESDIDWRAEETQEEYAVLDKAGRVQIPREMLEQLHLGDDKVKLDMEEGRIIISPP